MPSDDDQLGHPKRHRPKRRPGHTDAVEILYRKFGVDQVPGWAWQGLLDADVAPVPGVWP